VCKEAGREGKLVAQKSPRSLKRFIRCTNYELCDVSYPLPQRGKLKATGETCEHCGAPIVEVDNGSRRGVWRLCVNYDCPAKAEEQAAKEAAGKGKPKGVRTTTSAAKRAKATSAASAGKRTAPKRTPKMTPKPAAQKAANAHIEGEQ
jgi:DNA topoisomerase-1